MNVWITATANYSLTYGFEELLDECFMTGSCVFLSEELMYLGATYLRYLPCCEYHREEKKAQHQSLGNQSITFSSCWSEVALRVCASQGSVELSSQQILSLLEDVNRVVEIVILANPLYNFSLFFTEVSKTSITGGGELNGLTLSCI